LRERETPRLIGGVGVGGKVERERERERIGEFLRVTLTAEGKRMGVD
jgi:hypothetical protein